MAMQDQERGKRPTIDPGGEVHGSGSGAGGRGNPDEDYDPDAVAGGGAQQPGGPIEQTARKPRHPLPASDEARHDQIPERLESEKGMGEDSAQAVQPASDAVTPDGEHYPRE
jgi:hypothetical protein